MKSSVLSRDLKNASVILGCFSSGANDMRSYESFQNFDLEHDVYVRRLVV